MEQPALRPVAYNKVARFTRVRFHDDPELKPEAAQAFLSRHDGCSLIIRQPSWPN